MIIINKYSSIFIIMNKVKKCAIYEASFIYIYLYINLLKIKIWFIKNFSSIAQEEAFNIFYKTKQFINKLNWHISFTISSKTKQKKI